MGWSQSAQRDARDPATRRLVKVPDVRKGQSFQPPFQEFRSGPRALRAAWRGVFGNAQGRPNATTTDAAASDRRHGVHDGLVFAGSRRVAAPRSAERATTRPPAVVQHSPRLDPAAHASQPSTPIGRNLRLRPDRKKRGHQPMQTPELIRPRQHLRGDQPQPDAPPLFTLEVPAAWPALRLPPSRPGRRARMA